MQQSDTSPGAKVPDRRRNAPGLRLRRYHCSSPGARGARGHRLDDRFPIPAGGYRVTLDGLHSIRLETNGSHVFANLAAGDHTLELSELPVDCRVTGNNPRTVTAVAGATAMSVFLVTCMPPNSGALFIKTATYGKGPAGYEVSVDDGLFSEPIGTSDELTLFPVPVGVHTVALEPVQANCQLVGSNPRIVIIRDVGGFGGTIFKIHCPQ
jgi:hypothetical protein